MKGSNIAIIFIPAFVLFVGYIIYDDYWPKQETQSERKVEEDLFDVPVDSANSLPENRAEIYKQKWQREAQIARKVESPENFFAEEVKKDPYSENMAPVLEETEGQTEEKAKTVVIYRDRPEVNSKPPAVSEPKPAATTSKTQRKLGFTSTQSASVQSETNNSEVGDAIEIFGVIQDEALVKSGSNVLIRTTENAIVNGIEIPKNTMIYGLVSFSQERVKIDVSSIKVGNNYLTPKLKAYDLDGQEGLLVQGGIGQEVKKDALNDAVNVTRQQLNVPILRSVPSSSSRRIDDPSVPLPKGHKLILRL